MKKRITSVIIILCIFACIFPTLTAASNIIVREIASGLEFDDVRNFSEGLAAVSIHGKWGFIDRTGEVVIPLIYDVVGDFHKGLAAVRIGNWETGKWGFIDKAGNIIIPFELGTNYFDNPSATDFSEGLLVIRRGGRRRNFSILEIVNYSPITTTTPTASPPTSDTIFTLILFSVISTVAIFTIIKKQGG